MDKKPVQLLLADDDADDRMFFEAALQDLPLNVLLHTVNDGEELMNELLNERTVLPDIIFLDLNMSRKTGFECLDEIKQTQQLSSLYVIIYSTSFDQKTVDLLYEKGANRYIRKPGDFKDLKRLVSEAIIYACQNKSTPAKEHFVLGT